MDESLSRGKDEQVRTKQEIIKSVLREPPEKRVAKLVELGVLTDIEGYTWGNTSMSEDRFFVFVNMKGVPIPMYKTLKHTEGKRRDLNFFVFLGITDDGWLIKGFRKDVDRFYGIKELENASGILTSVFDFDTSRSQSEGGVTDKYVPQGKGIQDSKKLNELLSRRFNVNFKLGKETSYTYAGMHEYLADKVFGKARKAWENNITFE